MRTIQNLIGGLVVAAVLAVSATPALADQAVTVTNANGSKACVILSGVERNASDFVKAVLGVILDKLGCLP